MSIKKQRGFSLIELLVVIAIIGILATIGTISYTSYTETARKGVAEANFLNVVQHVELIGQLISSGLDKTGGLEGDVSTAENIAKSIEDDLSDDIKNPFISDESAVFAGAILTDCQNQAGKIILYGTDSSDEIIISSCYADDATVTLKEVTVQ